MNEHQRLQRLDQYAVQRTASKVGFNDLVNLAAAMCHTSFCTLTLPELEKQWCKAKSEPVEENSGQVNAWCAMTMQTGRFFMVTDLSEDLRFSHEPMVQEAPFLRFYAGVPLRTQQGKVLGTLAVMDDAPCDLLPEQQQALEAVAANVVARLALQQQMEVLQKVACSVSPDHENLAEACETLPNASSSLASLCLRNRALAASVSAIIITDHEGVIEYANPAFERITGYPQGETLGRHFRFLQGDDFNQPGLATVRKGLCLHETCSAVLRNYR